MQNHQRIERPMLSPSELFSDDLERKALGICFANPDVVDVWTWLKPEHFNFTAHAEIFKKLKTMRYAGEEISAITFTLDAENSQQFQTFGGLKNYLGSCVRMAITDIETFDHKAIAMRVMDLANRRALREVALKAIASIEDLNNDVGHEVETLSGHISNLQRSNLQKGFRDEKEVCEAILQNLKDLKKPHSTGLIKLDEAMDGGIIGGDSEGGVGETKGGDKGGRGVTRYVTVTFVTLPVPGLT